MANGNIEPVREIAGQGTKMGRTIHAIAYNPVRDEIVVGNPLAAAVLVFRGEANGDEAPRRILQGPHTKLVYPHTVAWDARNNEIWVADPGGTQVMAFPGDGTGDVAPLRVIRGPQTKIYNAIGVAVDPIRDLLVVTNFSPTKPEDIGVFIFNRTDNGDVAPRAMISGPRTGLKGKPWQVQVSPELGKIFVAVSNHYYYPLYNYDDITLRKGVKPDYQIRSPWSSDRVGFIGVWNITDNGDVPPQAIIRGPTSGLVHPSSLALNVKDGEIYVADSVRNGLLTFLVPEFFRKADSN